MQQSKSTMSLNRVRALRRILALWQTKAELDEDEK